MEKKFKDKQDRKKSVNCACSKIQLKEMTSEIFSKEKELKLISFNEYNYLKFYKNIEEKPKLIYRIIQNGNDYAIMTGLYVGIINVGEYKIEIRTQYTDLFLKRMINFCCGIYVDISPSDSSSSEEGIYSLIVQYLFVVSLRKVLGENLPKRYVCKKDRDYSILGNVDIERYINRDLSSSDKKISFKYPEIKNVQNIIDILYIALKHCKLSEDNLPNISNIRNYLSENYSGIRPSKFIVNGILKNNLLKSSLYSNYKKPLMYAQYILNNRELSKGNNDVLKGISGYLVDSSFVWEMYLYNLMKIHFNDWEVRIQEELNFYAKKFYKKNNYPDFVLCNKETGNIVVLDAKFKKMEYNGRDIDNADMRQLHSYAYYYHLKYGEKFKGAGLIYPTEHSTSTYKNNIDAMYGIEGIPQKFGVFTIKDPSEKETIMENEKQFIRELRLFIDS